MIPILILTLVFAVFLLSYFGCVYYEKQSMDRELKLVNMEQELMNSASIENGDFYIELDNHNKKYYPRFRKGGRSYYLGHNYQYRTWCHIPEVLEFDSLEDAQKAIEPWLKMRNSPRITEFPYTNT